MKPTNFEKKKLVSQVYSKLWHATEIFPRLRSQVQSFDITSLPNLLQPEKNLKPTVYKSRSYFYLELQLILIARNKIRQMVKSRVSEACSFKIPAL